MNVELFGHESVHLRLGTAVPRHGLDARPVQHVALGNAVPATIVSALARRQLVLRRRVRPMLRLRAVPATLAVRPQRLEPAAELRVDVGAGLAVRHAAGRLSICKRGGRVDAVVVAQVVKADVVHRVVARLRDAVIDAAPAPRDGPVLVVHDGARAESVVAAQVAGEGGDCRHDHDDFELLTLSRGSHDSVHDGRPDKVLDGALTLVRSRDEELVLYVYEVLGLRDDFYVRICNGVLFALKWVISSRSLTSSGVPLLHFVQLRTIWHENPEGRGSSLSGP